MQKQIKHWLSVALIYHGAKPPPFISAQNKQKYRKELGLSEKTGSLSFWLCWFLLKEFGWSIE